MRELDLQRHTGIASPTGGELASSPDESVRVLVVVPTLNEGEHIEAILDGLLREARESRDLSMKIVVVDGGSTDDTRLLVERYAQRCAEVRLLHNPQRIQSAALNLAVRSCGHGQDVLIRCDAHAAYPEDYCRKLVESLRRTGADAVVVPLDSEAERGLQRAVAWLSNSPLGTGGSAHRAGRKSGFVDHGHHAAFKIEYYLRAGGYDETFTHNEDAEFDCRQRALGARIYLDANIRVRYRPRGTLRALARQYFKYGAGRSRTFRRHPRSLRLRQLAVPAHLLLCVLAIALSPLAPAFLLWPLLYLVVVLAVSIQLSFRHRSFCGLLAVFAAPTMHAAWACGFLSGFFSRRERAWQRDMAVPLVLHNSGSK